MGAILEGDRSGFAHHGPKEQLSKEMILRAEEGDYDWVYRILRDDLASADVADAKGYTVLAAATVSPSAGSPPLSGATVLQQGPCRDACRPREAGLLPPGSLSH